MDYVRISASYLFNIKLDDKFLLIKSERRNQYQPIGGCYKYFADAEEFLFSIEAIPEKMSNGVDSLMDLRLLIPRENIDTFVNWFNSGENRETTFDRELNEELISMLNPNQQDSFNDIKTQKMTNGSFDVFYDEEKGIDSIKPMDIIAIELTNEQKQILKNVCASQSGLMLASEDEILSGYKKLPDGSKIKIGSHTKNILPPQAKIFE